MNMAQKWRTVRIFISSTFKDMQGERDHLVRFVFPRLREQLLVKRIHLVDVDLRWGITREEDASEVCREIITECRPRFLCMLGGRYGTIPEGRNLSITAEEVHFGVLDADRENIYGLFYFRHGAVTEKMNVSHPGLIREPRHSEKSDKLARLKRRIRKAKCKPFLYRPRWNANEEQLLDLKAFGDRVVQDILATIDDEFGTQPPAQLDEFAEENAAMEAFVQERSERFVLGSRKAVLDELLAHTGATGGNGYICLTGAPGSGKSALLGHLSQHSILNDQSSVLLIRHFVGASPGSTDVRRTLRRLCHELKAGCPDITADISDDPEKLRVAFPDFLRQACVQKRVVILLDAVNQFDTSSYFGGLNWLSENLPTNARIILSAIDSSALEELRRRPCKPCEIELKPLTSDDGEAIIGQFLKRYRKKFEPDQRTALLAKTDAGTPLYLLAALEELRTLGTYEEITRRISELPSTTHELFVWILKRLEDDDGFRDAAGQKVGHDLVSRFATLLGASRHGLSQRELADLLDAGDPQGNIAALLHLLRPYLMRRGELLDFYHGQFREAVEGAWLKTDVQRQAAHAQLANVLQSTSLKRQVSELTFHLRGAGNRDGLKETLCRLDLVDWALDESYKYKWLGYWRWLEGHADPAICYARSLDRLRHEEGESAGLAAMMSKVANLLSEMGRAAPAFDLAERALSISKTVNGESHPATAHLVGQLARGALDLGKYHQAKSYYEQLIEIDARMPMTYREQQAAHISAYGVVLQRLDEYDQALKTYSRALEICEMAVGADHPSIAPHLHNMAGALREMGRLDEAEHAYNRALRILEKRMPGTPTHAAFLSNLAMLYQAQARYSMAMPLLERALEIDTRLLGHDHPAVARRLTHIGACCANQGEYVEARRYYEEALRICQGQDNNQAEGATVMVNLGLVLVKLGQYKEAEALLKTALTIDERVFGKEHTEVAGDLNALACLYDATGRPDQAFAGYQRARQILQTAHPESIELAKTLHNLGRLYASRHDHDQARRLYQDSLRIKQGLLDPHHPSVVATQVALESLDACERGEPASLAFLERAVQLLKAARDPASTELTEAMAALGITYYKRGRLADAEQILREALDIDRNGLPSQRHAVARDLASLAVVYDSVGREDDSIFCREEASQILQEIAPQSFELAGLLVSLGHAYARRGDDTSAITVWERAAAIQELLRSRSDSSSRDAESSRLATTLANIATLHCERGRTTEATRYATRARTVLEDCPESDRRLTEQLVAILADCRENIDEGDST
ncbi:tetratricopeptide repeat protein [Planctomycetota bacterium]